MSIFPINSRPDAFPLAPFFGALQRAALEFIYPPACLLCRGDIVRPADGQLPGDGLCSACLDALAPPAGHACRRCGAPVGPFTVAEADCLLCRRENFAFDEVVRLGLYRDELRIACLRAKNPSGALLAQTLADLLVDARRKVLEAIEFDAVVPVPEHWFKRLLRPQYAAETMARQISRRLNVRLATGILAKCRWTPKQAKSPPARRRQQQQRAFGATRQAIRGQTILLVDDILTTGATADAAARELKRAGARRVVVAVAAVSPPRL